MTRRAYRNRIEDETRRCYEKRRERGKEEGERAGRGLDAKVPRLTAVDLHFSRLDARTVTANSKTGRLMTRRRVCPIRERGERDVASPRGGQTRERAAQETCPDED